jgi:hypothetical protein
LIRVTTMRRLGGSVNADIIVIDGVMTGDGVIMGDGKFGEVGGSWDINDMLGWTTMGRDIARFSLVSLRLCVWLCGVVKVLQLEGVCYGSMAWPSTLWVAHPDPQHQQ